MIVVSFYTNEAYRAHAERLKVSLDRLGIRHDIVELPDRGGSRANILQKPAFLRDRLRAHRPEPILWIDADALVSRPLDLLSENGHDVGVYSRRYIGDVWAGTVYFAQTTTASRIVDRWVERCERRPDLLDQVNLRFAIWLDNPAAKILHLPPEYCWVERMMRNGAPDADPVIEHLALSLPGAPAELRPASCETLVSCYHGLGDTFYMRPAVRKLARARGRVHVATPWPQLWTGEPGVVVVMPPSVTLRTQRANLSRTAAEAWMHTTDYRWSHRLKYDTRDFRASRPVVDAFLRSAGLPPDYGPDDFHWRPDTSWTPAWAVGRRIGIVHMPSVKREWNNPARNPDPANIQAVVDDARDLYWVSVGWDQKDEEWTETLVSGVDKRLEHGELTTEEMIGLIAASEVVVSGPCYLLPAAMAMGTPVFCVFGGSVPPHLLIDPRMGATVNWAAPDPFCACYEMSHDCAKGILRDELLSRFRELRARRAKP